MTESKTFFRNTIMRLSELRFNMRGKYVRDKSGRAIPTFGKVGSGRDLPSRLFSKVGSGRDWPSRTLKIVEVSREKSREVGKSRGKSGKVGEIPIFPDF